MKGDADRFDPAINALWRTMELCAFSSSLAVKHLEASKQFYEKFGFKVEADVSTTGPASFVAVDPDGNPILVDQQV